MRALVTGGAGFIGSNLVDGLIRDGWAVHVVDDLSSGRRSNLDDALAEGAVLHVASIADAERLRAAMAEARPDVVFHLAAQIDVRRSVADPGLDARLNVAGTADVLELARLGGARRVLLASTAAVYGQPTALPLSEDTPIAPLAPYGVSKASAEAYLAMYGRTYGLSTASLRLANVYGPRQDPHGEAGVIAIFSSAAMDGRRATIFGDGRQTRDYIYVGDVVRGFLAAARSDVSGSVNLSTGRETDLLEVARLLQLDTELAPAREGEIARSCLDPSRARRELGWSAGVAIDQGLTLTLESFQTPADRRPGVGE